MTPKYEFTSVSIVRPSGLHRQIRALRDIYQGEKLIVSAGALGGFLLSESNLSHDDSCWVHANAHVYDGAVIKGNAQVRDNARVYDFAVVQDEAEIKDNAHVSQRARVSGNAVLCEGARAYGESRISGDAIMSGTSTASDKVEVSGNAVVSGAAEVRGRAVVHGKCTITPICITGLDWNVTISDDEIKIGCEKHDMALWYTFTDDEISKMDPSALAFWSRYKTVILLLAAGHKLSLTTGETP